VSKHSGHLQLPSSNTGFTYLWHFLNGFIFEYDLFKMFKDSDRNVAVYFSKHGITVTGDRPNIEFKFTDLL
jgi:hypothetical protein